MSRERPRRNAHGLICARWHLAATLVHNVNVRFKDLAAIRSAAIE